MSARMTLSRLHGAEMGRGHEYSSATVSAALQWLTAALDRLLDHLERRREHRQLAEMGDRELKDIGLTRSDIGRLAARRQSGRR